MLDNKTPVFQIEDEKQIKKIEEDFAYLLGSNGLFMKKKNFMFETITPTDGVLHLAEIKPTIKLTLKPEDLIPWPVIQKALAFFQAVYAKYKTESALFFIYDGKTWDLLCPKQEVSGGSVDYKLEDRPAKGFKVVGTIHSHADFSAFHSGIDVSDEEKMDGIHATMGFVNSNPTIVVSIVSGGLRQSIDGKEVITGETIEKPTFPLEWLTKVTEKTFKVWGGWKGAEKGDTFWDIFDWDFQTHKYLISQKWLTQKLRYMKKKQRKLLLKLVRSGKFSCSNQIEGNKLIEDYAEIIKTGTPKMTTSEVKNFYGDEWSGVQGRLYNLC